MARYTGPKSKIARRFKDPIFGPDKSLEKKNYGPGQHGPNKRRGKQSEYAIQLAEKQKAKYTYGILERQFSNMFDKASRMKGITGENLHVDAGYNIVGMKAEDAPDIDVVTDRKERKTWKPYLTKKGFIYLGSKSIETPGLLRGA